MNNETQSSSQGKQPLFITRFGLSDRTAIGVQTRLLLKDFPVYRHWYWHEALFDPAFPHSTRIENPLFARVSTLKRDTAATWLLHEIGLGQWRAHRPTPALANKLMAARDGIAGVYLAPIDAHDAGRMKAIAEILGLPFVLHLWDFLDNAGDPATRWLLDHARHLFCLNEPMRRDVDAGGERSSILTFRRAPTKHHARFKPGAMKIAIMGDIGSYMDGVRRLVDAVEALRRNGKNAEIIYIGNGKTLDRNGLGGCAFITATGFFAAAEQKDKCLAGCSAGFLPGPTGDPASDARSRYSIPSRVLDFLAIGLPLAGAVHPGSATYGMCRDLGLAEALNAVDGKTLARQLDALTDEVAWNQASRRSLAAFDKLIGGYNLAGLKAFMLPA